MSTGLSPENDDNIDLVVANGLFHDRGEALNTAIELLKRREGFIRDVNSGIEELEKGLGEPIDIDAMMAEIDDQWETP